MKINIYLLIMIIIVSSSCAGTKKRAKKGNKPLTENVAPTADTVISVVDAAPIKEIEEKLVPINETVVNAHRYFVIIGSFRNPVNAQKYQGQISKEGFTSEVLKNEEGLYRVSVLATDDISAARDDIRRIRNFFPKYSDTWLLIQKKQ